LSIEAKDLRVVSYGTQHSTLNTQHSAIGLFSATMLVVGNTIGVGIFTTSGVMAAQLPSPGLLLAVWMLGGMLSLAGALVWAELGAMFPHAGGEYVYLREAFGPFWGFLCGWAAFLANFSGSIAVLAIALAEYIDVIAPTTPSNLWAVHLFGIGFSFSSTQCLAIGLVWLITLINYRGLHWGSVAQNLLSLSKLVAIAGLLFAGFSVGKGNWAHFIPFFPWNGFPGVFSAVGLALIPVVFAYSGWNAAGYIAGEVHTPETTLPRALVWGTVITIGVYLMLNVLYVYAVAIANLSGIVQVGDLAARSLFDSQAAWIVSVLIAVSIASAFNVMVLTGGRIYYAMAQDGVFFPRAARLHPRFSTPGHALFMQAAWTSLLILSGTFEQLLTYTTVVIVGTTIFTVVALFKLRRRRPDFPRPYRIWGYPWLPILFMLGSLGILLNALWERPLECLWGFGLCAAGAPAYWWWRRVDNFNPTA
jgi:APA family basic amino acid/polyamine antiporter